MGVFAVNPQEPRFLDTGLIESPLIVFPKHSIWIHHPGSAPFVADPTVVNFYNQGQTYTRHAINQLGDYCHWFRPSVELLSEMVGKEQVHFSQQNMLCPATVFLQHLMVLKVVTAEQQPASVAIDELVLRLLHELLSQHQQPWEFSGQKYRRHKRLVESVKESLQEDLSVNISLQELSRLHHTSAYHLSRVFKQVTGLGISQYRTQQRLRSLSWALRQDQGDLIELAMNHGFSSHSHMSACFKQTFGITPSDCQKQLQVK